jgi:hypothetical protein
MKARFAFAVYLAGDNNLAEEMVWSLQEMREASGDSAVRKTIDVAVLFDPPGGKPRRYDFPLSAADFSRPHTEDTEEPAKLLGRLVARMAPGRRFLVLSGHGSGAVGDFLNDEKPAGSLSIPRLGRILEKAGIEILGLDSCQMSTVEVGYEVRSSVSCLVASEGPVLNTGWPYRQILASVAETRAKPPSAVARAAAESYLRFYRDYEIAGVSTDIAVCDLSKIGAVAGAVGGLARAMNPPLSEIAPDGIEEGIELGEVKSAAASNEARSIRDAIVLAHWSAQSYKCDRYSDLRDFARQLLRFSAGRSGRRFGEIRKAGSRVLDAVDAAVVSSGTTGAELQHSHGLSIYFPWSSRDFFEEYRNLQFAKETDWASFLEVYLQATRRMRRFQPQHLQRAKTVAAPLRMPDPDADLSIPKDVEAGTRKDVEAGTRKGKTCRSTMKNPPDGYYPPRRK